MISPNYSQPSFNNPPEVTISRPLIRIPSSYPMGPDITDSLSTHLNFKSATLTRPVVKINSNNTAAMMKPVKTAFKSSFIQRPSFRQPDATKRDFRSADFEISEPIKVELVSTDAKENRFTKTVTKNLK